MTIFNSPEKNKILIVLSKQTFLPFAHCVTQEILENRDFWAVSLLQEEAQEELRDVVLSQIRGV